MSKVNIKIEKAYHQDTVSVEFEASGSLLAEFSSLCPMPIYPTEPATLTDG